MLVNIADRVSCVTNALRRASISPEAIRLARNELRSRLARPGATVLVGSTRVHRIREPDLAPGMGVACRTRKNRPRSLYSPPGSRRQHAREFQQSHQGGENSWRNVRKSQFDDEREIGSDRSSCIRRATMNSEPCVRKTGARCLLWRVDPNWAIQDCASSRTAD